MSTSFPAIYRGTVVDNNDPQGLGRLRVQVPAVLGPVNDNWAVPCVPYAGPNVGFFALPPVGAEVWIQFERGDRTLPVWTGGHWTKAEDLPVSPASPDIQVFRTEGIFLAHNNHASGGGTVKIGAVEIQKGFTLRVGSPVIPSGFLQLTLGADGVIEINNNDQETIRLSGGNITIRVGGASIQMNPVTVNVNSGALEVS